MTQVLACKTCSANLITVTNALPGAKAMDGDVTVSTGACAVRTFTCLGTNPTIEVHSVDYHSIKQLPFQNNNGAIMDGDDGAVDGSTMLAVTCNAAGTAWESNGVPITNVECTIREIKKILKKWWSLPTFQLVKHVLQI